MTVEGNPTSRAEEAAKSYAARPWTALYRPGDPTEITPDRELPIGIFEAAVAADPEGVALYYFDQPITWKQVDELSDALAVALQETGFEPGDRLAIYLQNVPQFLIGMVTAWKTAAVMLTVNPMMKQREIVKQFGEIEPRALISLESLYGDVIRHVRDEIPVETFITTSELDFLASEDDLPVQIAGSRRERFEGTFDLLELCAKHAGAVPPPVATEPGDLAQVMYTSGSTGMPKASMSTHANVAFNCYAFREWLALGPDDVCYAAAPLVHITGVISFLGAAMTVPMPTVLAYRFNADHVIESTDRLKCTYTICPPTAIRALIDSPARETADVSSLTKFFSGGVDAILDEWEEKTGNHIYSIYGSTECTSPTHCVPLNLREPSDPASGRHSIGIPWYNTDAKIVDDQGEAVPVGEIGEIVVSGPQVGLGYWNLPDVDVFRDGVYHTGDIGFMNEEGWFFIVDRKKDMIDAAGFKISPLEVEAVLYEHPSVREAAVIGVPDDVRGETVKAVIVLHPGTEATEEELIAFAKERMAAYKYPRSVEIRDELPKSDLGKILKSQLA